MRKMIKLIVNVGTAAAFIEKYRFAKFPTIIVLSIGIAVGFLGIQPSKAQTQTIVLHGDNGGFAIGKILENSALTTLRGDLNLRFASGSVPNVISDPGVFRLIDRIIISIQQPVKSGQSTRRQGLGGCYVA